MAWRACKFLLTSHLGPSCEVIMVWIELHSWVCFPPCHSVWTKWDGEELLHAAKSRQRDLLFPPWSALSEQRSLSRGPLRSVWLLQVDHHPKGLDEFFFSPLIFSHVMNNQLVRAIKLLPTLVMKECVKTERLPKFESDWVPLEDNAWVKSYVCNLVSVMHCVKDSNVL